MQSALKTILATSLLAVASANTFFDATIYGDNKCGGAGQVIRFDPSGPTEQCFTVSGQSYSKLTAGGLCAGLGNDAIISPYTGKDCTTNESDFGTYYDNDEPKNNVACVSEPNKFLSVGLYCSNGDDA